MSEISQHIDIAITADSVGVARRTFKRAAILSHNAAFAEPYRIYTRLADVITDLGATSPEALAAGAMLGQSPKPREIMILKATGTKPTQRYTLSVSSVRDSYTYRLKVIGDGVTATTAEYTSDASATDGEIVVGLVAALNAVTGKNFTAAGTTSPFTITADAPGEWFSVESLEPTIVAIRQNHADPGVAAALSAVQLLDDSWYWLVTLYNSDAYASAVATWAQGARKLYVVSSSDSRDLGSSTGTAGTGDVLKALGQKYVAGDYHPSPAVFSDAALVGVLAPREPGSYTAKFKQRAGIPLVRLTTTQRANLIARNMNFYEPIGSSVSSTSEGTTMASTAGIHGFIDNVVALDYAENEIGASILQALASADKVERTDEGMTVIETALRGALDRIVDRRIAARTPEPQVEVPLISEMTDLLPRGVRISFSFTLAGAIHAVDVTGVVSL